MTGVAAELSAGLDSAEAARRLAAEGPNEVPRPRPRTTLARIGIQLTDPMMLLLLGAFVVVCWLRDFSDAAIIAAVAALNTTLGVAQERRAERAIAALDEMATPRAHVRRDGRLVDLPARELVRGDEVRLEAGDIVPADLELVEAVSLAADEASMTGESVPVPKAEGEEVLAGTVVTRGRGRGIVVRVGAESGLGRIAALIATTRVRRTPLQRRLARLSRELTILVVVASIVVMVLSIGRGQPLGRSLVLAVSLSVAAIPESLPAVVSVALALGAYRMARQGALVRWLPAVETLGSVSLLASDKTGTLTEGRMEVRRLWTPSGPTGIPVATPSSSIERLLRDLVLCNDARITRTADDGWSVIGDPMEGALLIAAASYDESLLDAREVWHRVGETPFDSGRQWMATQHSRDGVALSVTKGAPEAVLAMAPSGAARDAAHAEAAQLSAEGYRILAVVEEAGSGQAVLVGLVGLVDPPREDAASLVSSFHDAGIRTILVSGDHPATARNIAEQVGIADADSLVVEGEAFVRGERAGEIERIDVFARVKPEQKVAIVEAWRRRGRVVAMTGDGVNDAPALRCADVGVAMGARGTEVARQAADVVLSGDDLRSLIGAVAEGRRINANIRTFLRYGLSGGLAEVLVLLIGPFLGMPVPLLPGQVLWINMLTHGLPGVAFGAEPLDPHLIQRPSPPPEDSVLGGGLMGQILAGGGLIGAASLTSGLIAVHQGWPIATSVFMTLGLAQLATAMALRAHGVRRAASERSLEAAVAVSALLQVLGVVAAPLRDLLGTATLTPAAWVTALALAALPALALVVREQVSRSRRPLPRGSKVSQV